MKVQRGINKARKEVQNRKPIGHRFSSARPPSLCVTALTRARVGNTFSGFDGGLMFLSNCKLSESDRTHSWMQNEIIPRCCENDLQKYWYLRHFSLQGPLMKLETNKVMLSFSQPLLFINVMQRASIHNRFFHTVVFLYFCLTFSHHTEKPLGCIQTSLA